MIDNIVWVFHQATEWERKRGFAYYDWQRNQLALRAKYSSLPLHSIIAAFAVLTPNNAEKTTYRDIDVCIKIASGILPESVYVGSFPRNKTKALQLLRGAPIMQVLSGQKVTAFYHNTLNPDDSKYVTIDGHMLNAYENNRRKLTTVRKLSPKQYALVADEIRKAASNVGWPAPRFQSVIWLTWKRIHKILWTPQLNFDWENGDGSRL